MLSGIKVSSGDWFEILVDRRMVGSGETLPFKTGRSRVSPLELGDLFSSLFRIVVQLTTELLLPATLPVLSGADL